MIAISEDGSAIYGNATGDGWRQVFRYSDEFGTEVLDVPEGYEIVC